MPKTYTEGHKAREITLAEAAIVKLREADAKAMEMYRVKLDKAEALKRRAAKMAAEAKAAFERLDTDRKINAAEAHLAWLRAMPVPEAVTGDGADIQP